MKKHRVGGWIDFKSGLASLTRRQPHQRRNHDHGVDRQGSKPPRVRGALDRDGEPDRADDRSEQDDPDGEDDE